MTTQAPSSTAAVLEALQQIHTDLVELRRAIEVMASWSEAAAQERGAQPPQQAPRGGSASYSRGGGLSVVWVNEEPCCSMHKTSEGRPRPMRSFGDVAKCTAKKRDGSYCTNEYRQPA